jgi:cell division protein FtsI/penicillin-binding protein 2
MTREYSWRYTTLGLLLTALALFIIVQMVRIQVSPQAQVFRDQGQVFSGNWRTILPARGQIYDRNGHLLAGNTTVYEAGVELALVKNPSTIALAINAVTGADYDQVFSAASPAPGKKMIYAVLANYVTEEQKTRLEQFAKEMEAAYGESKDANPPSLAGLEFTPRLMRSYPEKELGSNILGFVSHEGKGYFGVEEKFNDMLAGTPETIWVSMDPNKAEEIPEVPPGASLILTIDRSIQKEMEDVLDKALDDTGADSGTILVMDPKTGEILAMATTPRLDLNEFWRYGEVFPDSTPFNRAISQPYEPGSVFKVLTMSTAIDSGTVDPDTPFLDTGAIEVGGVTIHNWDYGAWGPQTMLSCMQHSLNVCLSWVASKVGANTFYQYMQAFGIGHLTGIELAGENAGRLKRPGDGDWYEADLATNSFGQGVSATALQMITAVSALANNGKMMTPRILYSMIDDGRQYNTSPQVGGKPITADSAHILTNMLAKSLEEESSNALVEGYRVAGKTGTAEIPTPSGYTSGQTNASFVGWGPVDDPQFVVYVWLEKPETSIWGSVVAAPVFKEAIEHLVVLMNLPPDKIRKKLMDSQ